MGWSLGLSAEGTGSAMDYGHGTEGSSASLYYPIYYCECLRFSIAKLKKGIFAKRWWVGSIMTTSH